MNWKHPSYRSLRRRFSHTIVVFALVSAANCGGTTGHDDAPVAADNPGPEARGEMGRPDAGATPDASVDRTPDISTPEVGPSLDVSTGDVNYDVVIRYADAARLPDVSGRVPPDASDDAAVPIWKLWPVCAPDTVDLDNNAAEISSEGADCQARTWTRRAACDHCIRDNACGDGATVILDEAGGVIFEDPQNSVFPPCTDLRNAGTAVQGPGAGRPRYELCAELFQCMIESGCPVDDKFQNHTIGCYCGSASAADCLMGKANGPCKIQEEAAMETTDPLHINSAFSNLGTHNPSTPGYAGAEVNQLFICAVYAGSCGQACFSDNFVPDAGRRN